LFYYYFIYNQSKRVNLKEFGKKKESPFYCEATPNFEACLIRASFWAPNRLLIIMQKPVSSSVVDFYLSHSCSENWSI